jgi:ubiquinol-cytochrome c reductase cytochrome c subunit
VSWCCERNTLRKPGIVAEQVSGLRAMLDHPATRVVFLVLLVCQVSPSQLARKSSAASTGKTAPATQSSVNPPPGPQEPTAPPNGQAIFFERCAKCHGIKGEGVSGVVGIGGPNIQAEHQPGDVIAAMEVGPSHMPRFAYLLSVAEMRAVANYVTQNIAVIPLEGGDVNDGGRLFRIYCAPCHQSAVRGGALVFNGINAPALTGKSAALVAGAIRWGPGPMPAFPPFVIDDKQLASIVKYVELMQQPPAPSATAMNWFGPVAEGFAAWVVLFSLVGLTVWIEWGGKG